MKVYKIVPLIFAGFMCIYADPDISISGIISDNANSGISGAHVTLKNYPFIFTETDQNGQYHLSNVGIIIGGMKAWKHAPKILNNSVIFFSDKGNELAKAELFSFSGARLLQTRIDKVVAGENHIFLGNRSRGMYLVRLSVGTQKYTIKVISGVNGGKSIMKSISAKNENTDEYLSKKVADDIIDTLIVTARGFRNQMSQISSYQSQTINCNLVASNPWRPSEQLEHLKNMVKINAKGYDFEMGQREPVIFSNGSTSSNEHPVHTVEFTYNFWMDTTEVTQKEYDSIMTAVYGNNYLLPVWIAPFGSDDSYPAYDVYWTDAILYCNARSKTDGYDSVYTYESRNEIVGSNCELTNVQADMSKSGYRLPTEAEWEYACRGGTSTDFYWGKNFSSSYPSTAQDTSEISSYVIWSANAWDLGSDNLNFGTHMVASKLPNAYGLYDMIGNLSEHYHDLWSDYSYSKAIDPVGPIPVDYYELRGGNWGNDAANLRSANRTFNYPDYFYRFMGFRTVRSAE